MSLLSYACISIDFTLPDTGGESDLQDSHLPIPPPLTVSSDPGRRRGFLRRKSEDARHLEISHLRETIQSKEHDIAKLEKQIKKEGKKQRGGSRSQETQGVQELLLQMQDHLAQVDALKATYASVAGAPCEARRFFSRNRSDRMEEPPLTRGASDSHQQPSIQSRPAAIVLPGVTMEPIETQEHTLTRTPSAWQLPRPINSDADDEVAEPAEMIRERGRENALLVALFVLCLVATMLLSALFES